MTWPTAPREHDRAAQRRGHWARRIFAVGVALFLAATLLGTFGERTRSVSATSGPYEVTVHYPQVTRPGLSSTFEVVVHRTDGRPLPDQLTIEVSADYLRLWDDHGIEPEPDVQRADGEDVVWVVLPEGDAERISVLLDGRIDPSFHWGRSGRTTVYAGEERLATLEHRTWLAP